MAVISQNAEHIKIKWLLEDRKFFNKYGKDQKAMQIINALVEMIANFESQSREHIFSC